MYSNFIYDNTSTLSEEPEPFVDVGELFFGAVILIFLTFSRFIAFDIVITEHTPQFTGFICGSKNFHYHIWYFPKTFVSTSNSRSRSAFTEASSYRKFHIRTNLSWGPSPDVTLTQCPHPSYSVSPKRTRRPSAREVLPFPE